VTKIIQSKYQAIQHIHSHIKNADISDHYFFRFKRLDTN